MNKLAVFGLGAMLLGLSAGAVSAQPVGRPDVPPLVNKIDQFAVVVDQSGSMMMVSPNAREQKIVLAKEVLGLLNDRIPSLDYVSSVHTVCPASTVAPSAAWDRSVISRAVLDLPNNLGIYGRVTELGGDLAALAGQLPGAGNAVILVTDGWNNIGPDPVAQAQRLASSGTALHIISFADTPEGKAEIARLAAVNPATVCVNGTDLLMSPVALDEFVKAVFYEEAAPIVVDSVYFATGSYALDSAAMAALNNLAAIILNQPRGVRSVEIEGFTDSVGGFGGNNIQLSYHRATAVRDYLVSKGVAGDKIYTKGNSVSYQFTNATHDGRQSNRRADLIIN